MLLVDHLPKQKVISFTVKEVGYFKQNDCAGAIKLIDEVWKEIHALIRSLRKVAQPRP